MYESESTDTEDSASDTISNDESTSSVEQVSNFSDITDGDGTLMRDSVDDPHPEEAGSKAQSEYVQPTGLERHRSSETRIVRTTGSVEVPDAAQTANDTDNDSVLTGFEDDTGEASSSTSVWNDSDASSLTEFEDDMMYAK